MQALDSSNKDVTKIFEVHYKMFNAFFYLSNILSQCHEYVEEEMSSFENFVSANEVNLNRERFLHLNNFGKNNRSMRKAFKRRVNNLPPEYCVLTIDCPHHKGHCRVIEIIVSFIIHLKTLANIKEGKVAPLERWPPVPH